MIMTFEELHKETVRQAVKIAVKKRKPKPNHALVKKFIGELKSGQCHKFADKRHSARLLLDHSIGNLPSIGGRATFLPHDLSSSSAP